MKQDISSILKFYSIVHECHVQTVNYFASLLGCSFPDHDIDKIKEPLKTGYAYRIYKRYYPDFNLPDEYHTLYKDLEQIHKTQSPHHVSYYSDVSEIPDIRIYEMVCDWASASFRAKKLKKDITVPTLQKWFFDNMAQLPWTEHQLELLNKSFQVIQNKTDENALNKIWEKFDKIVNNR